MTIKDPIIIRVNWLELRASLHYRISLNCAIEKLWPHLNCSKKLFELTSIRVLIKNTWQILLVPVETNFSFAERKMWWVSQKPERCSLLIWAEVLFSENFSWCQADLFEILWWSWYQYSCVILGSKTNKCWRNGKVCSDRSGIRITFEPKVLLNLPGTVEKSLPPFSVCGTSIYWFISTRSQCE